MVCLIRILNYLTEQERREGTEPLTYSLARNRTIHLCYSPHINLQHCKDIKNISKFQMFEDFFYYLHELYDSNIHLVDLESTALPIKLSSHICGKVRAPSPCIAAQLVFKTILVADELPFLII